MSSFPPFNLSSSFVLNILHSLYLYWLIGVFKKAVLLARLEAAADFEIKNARITRSFLIHV